jgi:outer membrane lipoprotein-sorting protein
MALLTFPVVPAGNVKPEEIIAKFAARENEFRSEWQKYTYTQKIVFEVLSPLGDVRERQTMEIEVYFTNDGERKTRVVHDRGKLRSVQVTKEDLDDAINIQPFVLTTDEIPNYKIKYKGDEQVDELHTYIFDVRPRKIEKNKRYFSGRIWVESEDFHIVMTRGKAVPDYANNKFPTFETRREQIDDVFWFPTWTEADDLLTFGDFNRHRSVRIRELITYEDYRKFEVDTRIKYGEVPQE